MGSLEPRWGGSLQQMKRFASEAQSLITQNPKHGLLGGSADTEQCRILRVAAQFQEAHDRCDAALAIGDDPQFLIAKAWLLDAQKRHKEGVVLADQALRLAPQNRRVLDVYYRLHLARRHYRTLARALLTLRQLSPTAEWHGWATVWLLKKLDLNANQRLKEGKKKEASEYLRLASQLSPDDRKLRYRLGRASAEQLPALLNKAESRPDDFELRLQIAFIQANPDDPRAYLERGGAKWRSGKRESGYADTEKACNLGSKKACYYSQRMAADLTKGEK